MAENEGAEYVRRTPGTREAVDVVTKELGTKSRSDAIRDVVYGAAAVFLDGTAAQKEQLAAFIGIGRRRFRAGGRQ
jgi:hypothetical protein